ncbi:MAG: PH domain-containing protein [Caldiserica bacterium]|nr:PH domain-containing protein [Caldisericota bacterium]
MSLMVANNSQDDNVQVFYADKQSRRYCAGRIAIVLVSLVMIAVLASLVLTTLSDPPIRIMVTFLLIPAFAVFLYEIVSELMVIHFLPRMRYELRDDGLSLILGGQWKTRIPYASIDSVTRKNLRDDIFSSGGFPKAGALDLIYADEGTISMYSTHLHKDVILIKTKSGMKYGISPMDPDGFLKALGQILDNQKTTC